MTSPPSLYLVACSAPPVLNIAEAITDLQDRWDVSLILSPTAATWIDVDEVAASTGVPGRWEYIWIPGSSSNIITATLNGWSCCSSLTGPSYTTP
jgi:hypothetical protein